MKKRRLNLAKVSPKKNKDVLFRNSGTIVTEFPKQWVWLFPLALIVMLYSCNNNSQLVQQYKTLHEHDSLLMVQTSSDDSTIRGYVHNLNDIQSNLDEIKAREKIIKVHDQGENKNGNTTIEDIKDINNLIIKSHREIAGLKLTIRKMNVKEEDMETTIARLSTQLTEKDTEIAVLLSSLTKVNNSYEEVTRQFNDSIAVLQNQNARIEYMTNAMNTVYYAIGTEKELKDNKVITKIGGFVGIGKNTELTPNKNTSYFTKTDLTKLNVIPLNAKFKRLLTTHPAESYKITGDKKTDSLVITNQTAFWSENKYLVIAVK